MRVQIPQDAEEHNEKQQDEAAAFHASDCTTKTEPALKCRA